MSEQFITVNLVLDNKTLSVPYTSTTTAEDICIYVCKKLNINTIARHLFALRIAGNQIFLMPGATFKDKPMSVDFRIRFRVANVAKLKKIDPNAYNYYFFQIRSDALESKIPDLVYEKYRSELVGLAITDMYRVMLEKDIPRETVESEYKKYIPKDVLKKHPFFIKKPIHNTLTKLQKSVHEAGYVKAEYIKKLESLAPEYLTEVSKGQTDIDGVIYNILIKYSPFHPKEPGLKYCLESKQDQWYIICTIDELGYISIRDDCTIEVSRKNGIPFYIKFMSIPIMLSFISLLDGYYRLTCKWTFNICKEVRTPSLQKLYHMKCHGPVGGEFSYEKLESKRSNRRGCFIVRESENSYNHYYLDVCIKEGGKPKTFKIDKLSEDEFILDGDLTRYKNLRQLMEAYSDPNLDVYLQECLPPSETDKSLLLLCASDSLVGDSLTDSSALTIPKFPVCINGKDLQLYKGHRKEGSRGLTLVYRGMWKVMKGKKIEVAMKTLKPEHSERYLKDYLNLAGQWAFLQSDNVVRLYGIAFTSNISFVLEYFKLGPLQQYLRDQRGILQQVDLIEAASNLASALWHLNENDIVHGNIRCRKIMVNVHDDKCFNIKLADPGIHTEYASTDVHWIPVECYSNLDYARRSKAADVWSFATTLWEIFTYGGEFRQNDHVEAMRYYKAGKRLPKPTACPREIYAVMQDCWNADPHRRKVPHEIVRDINQILYQVFNSRKTHSYVTVLPKKSNKTGSSTTTLNTESTLVLSNDDLISVNEAEGANLPSSTEWLDNCQYPMNYSISHSLPSDYNCMTDSTSLSSLNSLQSIFELDDGCNVVLQGRIGEGFYGEVFRGMLESWDRDEEPRRVAVKRLKSNAVSACLQDFEREINIMKTLKHDNVISILGVLRDPEVLLVMEFMEHSSLQTYLKTKKESLQTKQLLNYASDIAKGMEYLGKKNIVHRDLAARNILVVDENHVKISDFGLAQVIGANDYYILKTPNRELPIKWYAPESLADGKFSVRSDVWSYGVTMCEMFSYGEEPNLTNIGEHIAGQEQQILLSALEKGARFPCPADCPQAVYVRIIYPCWDANPHNRPPFSKLVSETLELLVQY